MARMCMNCALFVWPEGNEPGDDGMCSALESPAPSECNRAVRSSWPTVPLDGLCKKWKLAEAAPWPR